MPGWNGAGTFVLPYSMVAEAAAGVKILASHQDTQWNAVKAGLELCLTRDGQNSPSADINWGGFRITNLGAPVASTDAVTLAYAQANNYQEWIPEVSSVTWVGNKSFKVNAIDQTLVYTAGRRLKIVHNTGATTVYATVVSSAFVTDTTVTVATDDGSNLVSTVTAASYGVLTYANPAYLDPRSAVFSYVTSNTAYVAATPITSIFGTDSFDTLSEWDGATFSPKFAGKYLVSAQLTITTAAAGGNCVFMIVPNLSTNVIAYENYYALSSSLLPQTIQISSIVSLPINTWSFYLSFSCDQNVTIKGHSTGGGVIHNPSFLSISRIA